MGTEQPPAAWPEELTEVFERSATAEYASLTRSGRPVTVPVSPYVGEGRRTLDVSTGLTYPSKADRARANPKVSLLYADSIGEGAAGRPVVLVQGHAAVRDADLQANTDRYMERSAVKYPATIKGVPGPVLGRMGYYCVRIWIEVTPLRVLWWPSHRLDEEPREWLAPADVDRPASDPPPAGSSPPPWRRPPDDWRPVAGYALEHLGLRDLTTVGVDGYPVCAPVTLGPLEGDGLAVQVGPGGPHLVPGPACCNFHSHAEVFAGQENRTLVGELEAGPDGYRFTVARALGDWSAPGNKARVALAFLAKGPRLGPRLKAEAARRGQSVPKVRLPRSR
jgi:hypothetical protein